MPYATLTKCAEEFKNQFVWCRVKLNPKDPNSNAVSLQANFGEKHNYQRDPGPGYTIVATDQCRNQ